MPHRIESILCGNVNNHKKLFQRNMQIRAISLRSSVFVCLKSNPKFRMENMITMFFCSLFLSRLCAFFVRSPSLNIGFSTPPLIVGLFSRPQLSGFFLCKAIEKWIFFGIYLQFNNQFYVSHVERFIVKRIDFFPSRVCVRHRCSLKFGSITANPITVYFMQKRPTSFI